MTFTHDELRRLELSDAAEDMWERRRKCPKRPAVVVLQSVYQARIYAWACEHWRSFTAAEAATLLEISLQVACDSVRKLARRGYLRQTRHRVGNQYSAKRGAMWVAVPPDSMNPEMVNK